MADTIYEVSGKPPRFELKLSLLFAALFMPNAVYLSFFPLWLEFTGLTPVQISTMLSLPVFVRLLTTPFITHWADRAPERASVLILISALSLISALFLFLPLGYVGLLCAVLLLALFWSPQVPIGDSIALSGMRRYGTDYASIRLWGSVVFLAVNILAGFIIERTSPAAAIPLLLMGFVTIFAASLITPRLGKKRPSPTSNASKKINALHAKPVRLILISTALIQGSHGFMYSFGSIHWQSLGISAEYVGFLWAMPVLAEIIMFRFYSRLFGSISIGNVLVLSGMAAILRWALYGFSGDFNLGFSAFALIQILHAFTFATTYLAQQVYLSKAIPEQQAGAAQGLAVFVHGVAMAGVMFASGPLYAAFGGRGYLAMIALCIAGIAFAFAFDISEKARPTAQPHSDGSGG